MVPGARRIAVLRANGIGDFCFALPALDALRATYPAAEITLLGLGWHREFLAGRPGPVDRVEVVPPYPGVGAPEGSAISPGLEAFIARQRAAGYDIAFQMHGGGANSNPFVARLGAGLTVGLQARGAPPLDRTVPYIYYQSEVDRLLEVVAAAGAKAVAREPRLAVMPSDREAAAHVLQPAPRPLAVLHAGAGDPRRRWPPASFAEVGKALLAHGCQVAVTGAGEGDDPAIVRNVCDALDGDAVDLAGRLGLGGLAGLFERAAVVVANDTGPLHLAMAVGAPVVGIYWCGNAINAGPPWRTWTRPVLSWRLRCSVCGADATAGGCSHHETFVDLAPIDEVAWHALDLLQRREERVGARLD